MASVYLRGRNKRKPKSEQFYYVTYTDEYGRRRDVKGYRSKERTEKLAAEIDIEVALVKRGIVDPQQARLAEKRRLPLEQHLQVFERKLSKNTDKHSKLTMSRIRTVFKGCGFEGLHDLDAETAEAYLQKMQETEGLGHRTYNHYLQAIDSVGRWLVGTRRMALNPFSGMERLNAATDVRHTVRK